MSTHQDPLVDAITLGVPTLLQLLDGLTAVLERFNPDQREQLLAILQPEQAKLNTIQQTLETAAFPDHVARFGELLMEAINNADKAISTNMLSSKEHHLNSGITLFFGFGNIWRAK